MPEFLKAWGNFIWASSTDGYTDTVPEERCLQDWNQASSWSLKNSIGPLNKILPCLAGSFPPQGSKCADTARKPAIWMSESWRAKTWVPCHPHIWLSDSELPPFHPRWPHQQMKRGDFPTFYMVLGVGEFSFCAGPFRPLAIAWISLKTISDVILNMLLKSCGIKMSPTKPKMRWESAKLHFFKREMIHFIVSKLFWLKLLKINFLQ